MLMRLELELMLLNLPIVYFSLGSLVNRWTEAGFSLPISLVGLFASITISLHYASF